MDGYEFLILLPPALALAAAWLGARQVRRGARDIDRRRDHLHVLKEQAMQRESPPVRSSAPIQPSAPMQASAESNFR